MSARTLAWAAIAAGAVTAAAVLAARSRRQRDALVAQIAGELAVSREREGILTERLAWFRAAAGESPLRLVPDSQTPRLSAVRASFP